MKIKILLKLFFAVVLFIRIDAFSQSVQSGISKDQIIANQVCSDTVYSVPQNKLYFCLDGKCDPYIKLVFEINGSYGAGATNDSIIVWLMTDDKDGRGPLTSLPDSMVPGHDIRNSSNRARYFGSFIPDYVQDLPPNWVSPFSFEYYLLPMWIDSGRAICFTPIAWDSTYAFQLYEKDSCFGYGQPIQKIVLKSIFTEQYYSCDSGINYLHLITKGGLPQYNLYNGYNDTSSYSITVNSVNYTSHYGDTVRIALNDINYIMIADSLGNNSAADGCVIYYDTLRLYPPLSINNLNTSFFDNSPNDPFTISPPPSGGMRIDFISSYPGDDGIYLLNANGDTVYSKYPIGFSSGIGNIADIPSSLFIYDIPLTEGPYRIVATGDNGFGWQDASCAGQANNGHLKIFDLATGDSLSGTLYPVGDNACGFSGMSIADTFGLFTVGQYNKTLVTTNAPNGSVSFVDSTGNVIFFPSLAGPGNYTITFTYNDIHSNLCDKDTVINIIVNSSVGIQGLQNIYDISVNNPVHQQLVIKNTNNDIHFIEMIDATGRIVLRKEIINDLQIDIGAISQGVYLLKLLDNHQSLLATKKIIKE
jgi:hypothetical protein